MQAPVFRELYSEKRVVFEERRMRVDDSPMGKFQEGFAAQAMTNNYRRPVIGYPADLNLLGRREVQAFFNEHYGPQRLSIAVVGDVHVDAVSAPWQIGDSNAWYAFCGHFLMLAVSTSDQCLWPK